MKMFASVTNYGFCKYVNNCKFIHEKEECSEKSCDIQACSRKRYPVECKFYRIYQRYKFGSFCLDSHKPPCVNQVQLDDFEEWIKQVEAKIENFKVPAKGNKLDTTDFNLSDIENKIKEIWVTVVLMQKKVEDLKKTL